MKPDPAFENDVITHELLKKYLGSAVSLAIGWYLECAETMATETKYKRKKDHSAAIKSLDSTTEGIDIKVYLKKYVVCVD